jgi:hypothetical protein
MSLIAPFQDGLYIRTVTKIKSNVHPGMFSKSALFTSESYCCRSSVSKANSSESIRSLISIIELSLSCQSLSLFFLSVLDFPSQLTLLPQ